jgi:hypothetical protein
VYAELGSGEAVSAAAACANSNAAAAIAAAVPPVTVWRMRVVIVSLRLPDLLGANSGRLENPLAVQTHERMVTGSSQPGHRSVTR